MEIKPTQVLINFVIPASIKLYNLSRVHDIKLVQDIDHLSLCGG